MRVHYLQHVPFEGPGSIEPSLTGEGHLLSSTHLYKDPVFPEIDAFDFLIVMGGPMGIFEVKNYPWLTGEKSFIGEAIESGKTVLGICLGAQLIADVLGAKVYKNSYKEIGWFDIKVTPETDATVLAGTIPSPLKVFHWHGDTFDLPEGAVNIASSEACPNQGFILENRILALQFHLETTRESASALIENSRHELNNGKFIQPEEEMLAEPARFDRINQVMKNVLQTLTGTS